MNQRVTSFLEFGGNLQSDTTTNVNERPSDAGTERMKGGRVYDMHLRGTMKTLNSG